MIQTGCLLSLVAQTGCGLFLIFPAIMPLSASVAADRYQLFRSPGLADRTTLRVVPAGGTAPYTCTWSVTGPDGRPANERLDGLDRLTVGFTLGELDGPYRLAGLVRDAVGATCLVTTVVQVGGDVGLDITTERLGVVAGGGPYGRVTVHLNPRFGTPPFTAAWVCTAPDGRIDNDRLDTSDPMAPRFTSGDQVGTYILTATIVDARGATATQSTIIVVGQTLGADVVADRLTALPGGGKNGIVHLLATAVGGTAPYAYQWEVIGPSGQARSGLLWDTGVRDPIFESGSETGLFIVRCAITDAAGTVLIGSTSIHVGASLGLNITADRLMLPTGSGAGQLCVLAAEARGGQGPVTLRWSADGPDGADAAGQFSSLETAATTFASPDLPGSYVIRCTATDQAGATAVDSLTLSAGSTLGVIVSASNPAPAVGGTVPLGTAVLTARPYGGVAPYTYAWSVTNPAGTEESGRLSDAGSPAPVFTSSAQPGPYTLVCTVTDAVGAVAAGTAVLNVGQPLNVDVSVDRQTITGGGGVSGQAQLIAIVNGGVAPYGHRWEVSGPDHLPDPARLSDPSIACPVFTSSLAVGTYRLTLTTTDAMGVVFVDSTEVVVTSTGGGATGQLLSASVSIDRQNLGTGGETATAQVLTTGGVAPLAYQWSVTDPAGNPDDSRLDSTTGAAAVFTSNSTQGTYRLRCTVSDSVGSRFTDSLQLTVLDTFLFTLSASQTHLGPGRTVDLQADRSGGSGPFLYAWSCVDAGGAPAGSFALGSTGAGSALTASVGDFANTWTAPGGAGSMGAYRIRVTANDARGNTFSSSVTVTVNDSLIADATATRVYLAPGESTDLAVHLTGGTGTYIYRWTCLNAAGTPAGTFTTGSEGTGLATQAAPGDIGNTWTAPLAGPGVLGTCRIAVSVTDANGLDFTDTVTVIVDDPFSLDVVASDAAISAGGTTTLTANRTGGGQDFTFTWTARGSSGTPAGDFGAGSTGPGQSTQANRPDDTTNTWTAPAAAPGASGTYLITCVGTDGSGRTFTDSTEISVGPDQPLSIGLTANRVFIAPGDTVGLTATQSGGTAGFDYAWAAINSAGAAAGTLGSTSQVGLGGNASNTWTAPAAGTGTLGTYRIEATATDAMGRQARDTIHLVVASPLSLALRAGDPLVAPASPVLLAATPAGGEPPFSYAWQALNSAGAGAGAFGSGAGAAGAAEQVNHPAGVTNTWSVAAEGRYTILCTATDNTGQVFTDSLQVSVTAQHILLLDVLADRDSLAPGEIVNLAADHTGGTANFNYAWSVLDESGASAGTLGAGLQTGLSTDAANTWTAPTGGAADGSYRICCTVTDSAGRTFADSVVVTVRSLALQNIFFAPAVSPVLLGDTSLSNSAKSGDPGLQLFPANGLVSPGQPRNVLITIHDNNTSITGGLARVTGLDARGFAQSEVIVIGESQLVDNTYVGAKPFALITQVDLFGFTGTVNTFGQIDTVRIVAGDKFGLTGLIRTASDVAYVYEGGSVLTGGYTVDAAAGQQGITFNSAPDGSRNYIVVFRAR